MLSNRFFLVLVALLLSACSKLADYSADVTTIPAASPTISVTVPDPIHEWTFEGASGTDSGSVGGWTGSFAGAANFTTTTGEFKVGSSAAKFTGVANDGFLLGSQTLPSETTLACWVRWVSGTVNPNTIFSNSAASLNTDGVRFYVQTNGQLTIETGNGSAGVAVNSVSLLMTMVYTHVVMVADQVLNQSAIYINGALDQSGTVQSGFGLNAAAFLGTMALNTNPFKGDLDDCKLYNVALSSAQVTILYNSY